MLSPIECSCLGVTLLVAEFTNMLRSLQSPAGVFPVIPDQTPGTLVVSILGAITCPDITKKNLEFWFVILQINLQLENHKVDKIFDLI